MKYAPLVAVLALAGCPDDEPSVNAETLWLAPDGVETQVHFVEGRPPPF